MIICRFKQLKNGHKWSFRPSQELLMAKAAKRKAGQPWQPEPTVVDCWSSPNCHQWSVPNFWGNRMERHKLTLQPKTWCYILDNMDQYGAFLSLGGAPFKHRITWDFPTFTNHKKRAIGVPPWRAFQHVAEILHVIVQTYRNPWGWIRNPDETGFSWDFFRNKEVKKTWKTCRSQLFKVDFGGISIQFPTRADFVSTVLVNSMSLWRNHRLILPISWCWNRWSRKESTVSFADSMSKCG